MSGLAERDLKHIWHPCSQMKDYEELPPIAIKEGRGVYLYGYDGKEYIDIVSSIRSVTDAVSGYSTSSASAGLF